MQKKILLTLLPFLFFACGQEDPIPEDAFLEQEVVLSEGEQLLAKYKTVRLTADLDEIEGFNHKVLHRLVDAAAAMDDAFWRQAWGDKEALLNSIEDPHLRRFAEINYGPWDRLDGNSSFIDGIGAKPAGARFYPEDLSAEDLEAAAKTNPALLSPTTMVSRSEDGSLVATPYSEFFSEEYQRAVDALNDVIGMTDEPEFKKYLELRVKALQSNDYRASDLAWMDMKNNTYDIVIGPIENYEDQLVGSKTSNEAYVLIKDQVWSERLSRYASFLPDLQKGLPVPEAYKQEQPGTDSDLGAYDVVYYAGDCNAGSKTIAINLPNDEEVQLQKGTRRLQLKNAMRAKFDEILIPIAGELIAEDQRAHITFDAFFSNTMFHEVAHGLGIKNVIGGNQSVREALKARASALEEGKADILGLYMVTSLAEQGELDVDMMDHYVTFLSSIFRSIRFGSSSAHGVANLLRFNFFAEMGAFSRDETTGTYRVNPDKMAEAVSALSEKILRIQGDGDFEGAEAFLAVYGQEGDQLRADLGRLTEAGIPVDIVFEQGKSVLGI